MSNQNFHMNASDVVAPQPSHETADPPPSKKKKSLGILFKGQKNNYLSVTKQVFTVKISSSQTSALSSTHMQNLIMSVEEFIENCKLKIE